MGHLGVQNRSPRHLMAKLPGLSQVTHNRRAFTRGLPRALWLLGAVIQGSGLLPLHGLRQPRHTFQAPGAEGLAEQSCSASAQKGAQPTGQSQPHGPTQTTGAAGQAGSTRALLEWPFILARMWQAGGRGIAKGHPRTEQMSVVLGEEEP